MYNPNITGFSNNEGSFLISLAQAKTLYGLLPSSYRLLPPVKTVAGDTDERDPNKVLNLDLGFSLQTWLSSDRRRNLKPFVIDFYSAWHRDYEREFGVSVAPLRDLNDQRHVADLIRANRAALEQLSSFDVKSALLGNGILKKDILNSIPQDRLIGKGIDAISRKIASGGRSPHLHTLLSRLRARQVLENIPFLDSGLYPLHRYVDEIAHALGELSGFVDLHGCDSLRVASGRGVELTYAPRDVSYLKLGRTFGDCTSDKRHLQGNCQTENIFWTVFSWILDCNYQILVVTVDGKPAMKCHLLPLFVDVPQAGREMYSFLFIDAIETAAPYRVEEGEAREQVYPQFAHAFALLIQEVNAIADRMGVSHIYTERFSNSALVRHELEKLPEIYLNTKRIVKIDELEDVFSCAGAFCSANGFSPPDAVFMELQARNTCLISESIIDSHKSFGILRGDPSDGLPAKFAFGV